METDSEENSIVREKQIQYLYPVVTGGKYLSNRKYQDPASHSLEEQSLA